MTDPMRLFWLSVSMFVIIVGLIYAHHALCYYALRANEDACLLCLLQRSLRITGDNTVQWATYLY